ncbi:hypothetical protein DCS_03075 [Drechmeria coniospora]|uniref:Uncharacterized protein n=1 Tax=Drechmeria coniospora TaxID=98403 RepID=A0A151GXW8_DRECN|nr:hypothetical protein DCS_03075 [Drechmeria coniospora]KYK61930.1 hypothetical protein DCS_03075 [Drechmeria coniospora]
MTEDVSCVPLTQRPPYARLDDYPATLLPAISAADHSPARRPLAQHLPARQLPARHLLLGIFLLDIFLPNILLLSIFLFDLLLLDIVLLDIVLLDIVLLDIVLLDNLLAIILSNACTQHVYKAPPSAKTRSRLSEKSYIIPQFATSYQNHDRFQCPFVRLVHHTQV